MEKAKAIILDIDGTLTETVSWLAFTQGLGGDVDEHARIFDEFKNGNTTYIDAKKELITLWRATGNAKRSDVTRIFESWQVYPGVQELVAELSVDYKVCIITGSFDLWAKTLADRLSVKDWFANTALMFDDNDEIYDMDYTLKQAEKKLEHFEAYCAEHGLLPTECVAVGDSDNDIKLFEATGHGIAVGNAPTELLAVAEKKIVSITELIGVLGNQI